MNHKKLFKIFCILIISLTIFEIVKNQILGDTADFRNVKGVWVRGRVIQEYGSIFPVVMDQYGHTVKAPIRYSIGEEIQVLCTGDYYHNGNHYFKN